MKARAAAGKRDCQQPIVPIRQKIEERLMYIKTQ